MFPDEPLCAIPVEAFGGVANTRKMYTCFVGRKRKDNSVRVSMTVNGNLLPFLPINLIFPTCNIVNLIFSTCYHVNSTFSFIAKYVFNTEAISFGALVPVSFLFYCLLLLLNYPFRCCNTAYFPAVD